MQTKIFLNEDEMPRQWYNLAADLPGTINPPLGQDGKPMQPETLAAIFPMNLLEQEYSTQRCRKPQTQLRRCPGMVQ